jgi:hypothetical protein
VFRLYGKKIGQASAYPSEKQTIYFTDGGFVCSFWPKAMKALFDPTHSTLLKMPPMTHLMANEHEQHDALFDPTHPTLMKFPHMTHLMANEHERHDLTNNKTDSKRKAKRTPTWLLYFSSAYMFPLYRYNEVMSQCLQST